MTELGWAVVIGFLTREAAERTAIEIRDSWGWQCEVWHTPLLTPSADLPACRDEDPAHAATLAACYPDPPEYQHPEDDLPDPEPYWEAFSDGDI